MHAADEKRDPDRDILRILACQIVIPKTPNTSARDAHVDALCTRLVECAHPSAFDLIVLPELTAIEYSDAVFANIDELAEPIDGPSFQRFAQLARQTQAHVIFGFARKTSDKPMICQAVISPNGELVGYYDKLHLAQFGASAEAAAFQAGNHIFTFDVKGLKIAPMICYDIRFASLSARMADDGVDIVLQCSAYARDLSFHSWHPFVVTRAMENGLAWLGLNRAGEDWGGSIWCPGFADSALTETVFGLDEEFLDISLPLDFRNSNAAKIPILEDRRNDYANLAHHGKNSDPPDNGTGS